MAKKYGNRSALEACRWPMIYHARSHPESAIRLMRCILDVEDTNLSSDIETLVQSTMVLPAETVRRHFSINNSRQFMTIYRDKWNAVLEEYRQVIDDCAYLRASPKHPIRKAARFIQGALWGNETPSLTAVDTAFRNAKSRFPKSKTFLLSSWIKDIKSALRKLPNWEEVRRNVLYGTTN
ncbi:hypothetical protein Moror_5519 [Moniliophthora roreri MCA 2997]|uniref:Uncharacterized protein n=1 Tax=Moniliophthora roreri (strain MCA 2997) TaxID=1381753 RepID=V2X350_MONRO|nr:hypothetical protein Moror_5519 [Moniliophthora roreri MCA 2997]